MLRNPIHIAFFIFNQKTARVSIVFMIKIPGKTIYSRMLLQLASYSVEPEYNYKLETPDQH